MGKRLIPVSRLADYAADPSGFEERAGAPRSVRAAKRGQKHHDRLGRRSSPWWVLLAGLVLVLLLLWAVQA